VSGVWNDGDRDLVYGKDAPTDSAKSIDFRNTMNAAQFRLRVSPTAVEGSLKQSPSLSWTECFKIDRTKDPVKPGGYIGITAWSGSPLHKLKVSDLISIFSLEVNNFDTTSIGEEMQDVSTEISNAYKEMLTDENRHLHDQKTQSEHITRLVTMLSQHAEASKPIDEKIYQDLENLQTRMSKLDDDGKLLVKELQVLVKPSGETAEDEAGAGGSGLAGHIIGIRRLFVKEAAAHKTKIDVVRKNVAAVKQMHIAASDPIMFKEVAHHSEKVERTVQHDSVHSVWMLLAIVVCIVFIGYLMWNRMEYYERKHFL